MTDGPREASTTPDKANQTSTSGWIALARLLKPQGRRGELLADCLTDLPGVLAPGRMVTLAAAGAGAPQSGSAPLLIEEVWFPTGRNAGRAVLKLSGCDSISQAEAFAHSDLLIPAAELPPLPEDTFFVGDLIGCDVYDGSALLGSIVDVQFVTSPDGRTRLEDAAPLLAVQLARPATGADNPGQAPQPEPVLIPFVRAWLDRVDLAARRVAMHLPPGLLADPDEPTPAKR